MLNARKEKKQVDPMEHLMAKYWDSRSGEQVDLLKELSETLMDQNLFEEIVHQKMDIEQKNMTRQISNEIN